MFHDANSYYCGYQQIDQRERLVLLLLPPIIGVAVVHWSVVSRCQSGRTLKLRWPCLLVSWLINPISKCMSNYSQCYFIEKETDNYVAWNLSLGAGRHDRIILVKITIFRNLGKLPKTYIKNGTINGQVHRVFTINVQVYIWELFWGAWRWWENSPT